MTRPLEPSAAQIAIDALRRSIDHLAETNKATYRQAWRWGFVCGVVAAVLAAGGVLALASSTTADAEPVKAGAQVHPLT